VKAVKQVQADQIILVGDIVGHTLGENLANAQMIAYAWDLINGCNCKNKVSGKCNIGVKCNENDCPFSLINKRKNNPIVKYNGETLKEGIHYTVDRVKGMVTPLIPLEGKNNFEISWYAQCK
jgi:hypothetical protein